MKHDQDDLGAGHDLAHDQARLLIPPAAGPAQVGRPGPDTRHTIVNDVMKSKPPASEKFFDPRLLRIPDSNGGQVIFYSYSAAAILLQMSSELPKARAAWTQISSRCRISRPSS
ncbi:Uu.00g141600.m01.CDS01 [Anthostomella pinea]|uniref:Uu.00g141600.m01.CDS01 n=1 Tax=Anthostomella pinea TaxID=933095 RepID=A0AAI8VR44_9PEZI|nr:Uu.00g141600.m01.CDS01 [Anthostomella pinea]